jgi:hypothetical protein
MKRSLLKYSAWISLVMIAFSCRAPQIIFSGEPGDNFSTSIDSGSFEITTLKAKVLYKDTELSGHVLVKKYADGNYKVAFFNEMGMTFLDATLENKKLIIHDIIPVLDNKIFLRKFEKSMKAIL